MIWKIFSELPSGKTDEPIDFNYKELPQSQGRLDGSIIPPRVHRWEELMTYEGAEGHFHKVGEIE